MQETDNALVQKWTPVLDGIEEDYTRRVTAQLLENQAKAIVSEKMQLDEANGPDATTVGKLGTFQKFAFPLVRRVYPELIANQICGVQPMGGPVSQVFYLGHTRAGGSELEGQTRRRETVYSRYNLTYRGLTASGIGSIAGADSEGNWEDPAGGDAATNDGLDGDDAVGGFDLSSVLQGDHGTPSTTVGGKIASFPDSSTILGYDVSAGEALLGSAIPEINFHIEQQAVVARTRKMRALWTLEASQDLRAYHDLDLERELTGLLSKELQLEIDRELIEDIRMIAYDVGTGGFGGFWRESLANGNPNSFGAIGGKGPFGSGFTPAAFTWSLDAASSTATALGTNPTGSDNNVFVIDFSSSAIDFAPQHMGHVYANLLAVLNLASQDIYKTTWRGPGSWLLTSPLVASMLESAAKLEGGVASADKPTNVGATQIEHRGKFAGKYDLYVDPLYPEDEILMGYKGANAMDSGFVYAPYIPLQQLPTITDPETFQPRKGILTRYGKVAIQPESRFYRVIRVIGPTANYLFQPFAKNTANTLAGM